MIFKKVPVSLDVNTSKKGHRNMGPEERDKRSPK